MSKAVGLDFFRRPLILWLIVLICVVIELALLGADYKFWATPSFRSAAYQYGGFWTGLLDNWKPNYAVQPYLMFGTYAFLHSGISHLIVNMATLFSVGPVIVDRVGQIRFAALYVLAMIGGAIGFALISDAVRPMVGASGALFGLVGAIAAWEYVDRFTAKEGLWPVLRLVLFLIALNIALWWAMDGLLAWETHLGGFVMGWIGALLIDPRARSIPED